ncbi:MAG: hypothetical protein II992_03340 [Lachnospiraceae bacterium]|nr:hypothetical protein [Lachnospiraceae bacterium]
MGDLKRKLAKMCSGNVELNRKSVQIKRCWDDVARLLQKEEKKKRK